MSTRAICTCSHGLGVLRHADDCPVAIERRQPVRLAAPTSPSGPVPSTPRVWAMPEIPEDVSAVRDGTGNEWARGGKHGPGVMWHCRTDEGAYYRPLTTFELLRGRGPLAEVEETNDGRE